jgi:hypothetical protein
MPTTKETLTEEIISNARRDRKRLEAVADGLVNGFAKVPDETSGEEVEFDPEIAAAFAEEIAKIGDSLTKVNQQLVELVKIEQKNAPPAENPVKLGAKDVESVYDSIQPQEVN